MSTLSFMERTEVLLFYLKVPVISLNPTVRSCVPCVNLSLYKSSFCPSAPPARANTVFHLLPFVLIPSVVPSVTQ